MAVDPRATEYLLALDQGTTGSTALALSTDGRVLGRANVEFPQHFPRPGWVEHDPEEIWQSMCAAIDRLFEGLSHLNPKACQGIGITNQRETTVLWDRVTGVPVHRALVWQDRRTAPLCEALRAQGHADEVRARTGLPLDPYFSGTKLTWLLDNVAGLRARAGTLAFGTIDSWLVHKLTGGTQHVTDPSNASRTLLFNLPGGAWDPSMAELLNVPLSVLPEVRSSAEVYGTTRGVGVLPDGIPIAAIAGDQQSALFGQTCFEPGDGKCTYGTGAFLLVNTGTEPVVSNAGLISTVAWSVGGVTEYALEGSAFIAGAAVQWLRDELGIIQSSPEVEALAASVESSEGVMLVPAFAGLGAPHWNPHARGALLGLTRGSSRAHVARATLESLALQVVDLATAAAQDMSQKDAIPSNANPMTIGRLRVDGGAAKNNLLMQMQADFLGAPVDRPAQVETTALGAAYLAGLTVGVFPDRQAIVATHRIERTFEPQIDSQSRKKWTKDWKRAVGAVHTFSQQETP